MEQIQLRNEMIRLVNKKNKINLIVHDLLQWGFMFVWCV
jgi:hypothetical protein